MDPHGRDQKKNTGHRNEVLPQDTNHLIQKPFTNEEVRAKIQQAIGPHEDLLIFEETQTAVVWKCLPFIRSGQNYLVRHSGRRQGRQKKRWEDNVREWTCLEFAKSQRQ